MPSDAAQARDVNRDFVDEVIEAAWNASTFRFKQLISAWMVIETWGLEILSVSTKSIKNRCAWQGWRLLSCSI